MQQKYIVSKHAVNIETRTAIAQLAYLHIPHECSKVCYGIYTCTSRAINYIPVI